jgi:hypothetical protein
MPAHGRGLVGPFCGCPELLVAIARLVQAAVMNSEVGFDFGPWAQIHPGVDVPVVPGFIPLLSCRIQMFDQDSRFERNSEIGQGARRVHKGDSEKNPNIGVHMFPSSCFCQS